MISSCFFFPFVDCYEYVVCETAIVSLFCTLMRNSILYPIQHAMKPHIVVGGVRRLLSLVEILRKCDGRLRCDVARCMSLADEVSKITCKEYERELDALTNELEDSCARADANVNERMPSCSSSSSSSLDRQTTQDREKLLVQISAVQEVLPHLGEGFIAHCLLVRRVVDMNLQNSDTICAGVSRTS